MPEVFLEKEVQDPFFLKRKSSYMFNFALADMHGIVIVFISQIMCIFAKTISYERVLMP